LLEAERPQRSRTRFIGIALAITSHFDDPLGNDFAVEGVTKLALVRITNAALCITAKLARSCPLMGWSDRAPAPPAGEAGKGRRRRGARHVTQLNSGIAVIGIDIGRSKGSSGWMILSRWSS